MGAQERWLRTDSTEGRCAEHGGRVGGMKVCGGKLEPDDEGLGENPEVRLRSQLAGIPEGEVRSSCGFPGCGTKVRGALAPLRGGGRGQGSNRGKAGDLSKLSPGFLAKQHSHYLLIYDP